TLRPATIRARHPADVKLGVAGALRKFPQKARLADARLPAQRQDDSVGVPRTLCKTIELNEQFLATYERWLTGRDRIAHRRPIAPVHAPVVERITELQFGRSRQMLV